MKSSQHWCCSCKGVAFCRFRCNIRRSMDKNLFGMAWAITLLLTDFHLAPLEVISPVTYLSFQRKRPLIVRLNYHMGTGITWQCYSTLLKIDTWQFNFLTATMKLPHNKEYKTLYPHNHKDSLNFKSSLHCSLLWMGNNMVPYLLLF